MGRFDDRISDFTEDGRPGRISSRDFSQQDFPFDAFEFQEYDKVDEPEIRAAPPWKLVVPAADIEGTLTADQIDVGSINIGDLNNDAGYTDFNADDVENAIENNVTTIDGGKITTTGLFAKDILVGAQIRSSNYTTAGNIVDPDEDGFWLSSSGKFKAHNAELVGTLKTGNDTADDARVAIRDGSGIISGPTFSGSGINDLGIVHEGTVTGIWDVEITSSGTTLPSYSVGDTGPAGGTIIYDKGSVSDGWRYLEMWSSDEGGEWEWDSDNSGATGATRDYYGGGYENTYNDLVTSNYEAAYRCRIATHGGYNDWFLPTAKTCGDLMAIYGGSSSDHWSSTEVSSTYAYDGQENSRLKSTNLRVRAVRRFAPDPDEFRWRKDSGAWSSSITMPTTHRYLIPGSEITISFTEVSGRTVGDSWSFEQASMRGISIMGPTGDEYFSVGGGGVKLENLPTSDPSVVGQLWNDSGTIKVSSG